MAEKVENLKLKAVLLNNDSDSDWESKEEILGVSLEKLNDSGSDGGESKGDVIGFSLEKLNLGPAKKLLVLNLGPELYDRVYFKDSKSFPPGREADASYRQYLIYKRPYCEDYFKFCFQRFEVGIWSTAQMHNISCALSCVLGEYRSKLLFIWDQDYCTDYGFKALENKFRPIFLKDLKKLWDNPKYKGKYSSANTLMIDDKAYTALLNPPHTTFFLDEYKATHATDTALGSNGELRLYLEGLADADDVPTYVKEHPFGQPAIIAEHLTGTTIPRLFINLVRRPCQKIEKMLGKKTPRNGPNGYDNYDYYYDNYF